jgi:hypothetical protein
MSTMQMRRGLRLIDFNLETRTVPALWSIAFATVPGKKMPALQAALVTM